MPRPTPLFRTLLSEGWFVSVVSTFEDRVYVNCEMFSRDDDEETGYTDIVLGEADADAEPPDTTGLRCVGKFHGAFELRENGPAMLLDQPPPPSWGYREMPREMANAIAALITPANFPEAAAFMPVEDDYPDEEDARNAFWASINQQVSTMTAAGDPWGALKIQREAVDKLINWVNPPPEDDAEPEPEPNLDDMTPPPYSLLEHEDHEDEDTFLPIGSHLLPQDFQSFLRSWNKTIAASTGEWVGEGRKTFKQQNPTLWKEFRTELKAYQAVYYNEIEAVKAYQASPEGQAEADA
jgi:hypothetical protein